MRRIFFGSAVTILAIISMGAACNRLATPANAPGARPLADIQRTGWWVKVCPVKTDCKSITLRIGPDKDNINEEIIWHKGDPADFALKKNVDDTKIYCEVKVEPQGNHAYFGICHRDQVTCKTVDIANVDHFDVKRGDTDEWKCKD